MTCIKLVIFATFWLVVVPSSNYIPFESSYNVTSLSLNILSAPDYGCADCSGTGPSYANIDNLPPYTDSSFNFVEYPSGVCNATVTCNWTPGSPTSYIVFCSSNKCSSNLETGYVDFPEKLPAVIFDNGFFQITLVQINRCPSNTFYCGTACCDVGTVCSNPTTGQCCAGAVNTC